MPSYAHYYRTLIPHMPALPGSIHLHTHSPSVLTSPSGSRQQAGSGSLRARSWCWALSGRNHFPANSFTWKELLTGLTTCLFQPQSPPSPEERSYTSSAQAYSGQYATHSSALRGRNSQLGKTDTRFPNRISNHGIVSRFFGFGIVRGYSCRGPTGSPSDGRVEWRRFSPTVHLGYYICMHHG
jgi:hypothetical protein